MISKLLHLDKSKASTLQHQIIEQISNAIMEGHLVVNEVLPSSRRLAKELDIARNTVVLAYDQLLDDGYLIVKPRSGYYVNPEVLKGRILDVDRELYVDETENDWSGFLKVRPSSVRNVLKLREWRHYEYPFITGKLDPEIFPINNWRSCNRDAMHVDVIRSWAADSNTDDAGLIEQIGTKVLPRRGIWAYPEQILLTAGNQHSLNLLTKLLLDSNSTLGLEEPGYVDVRNLALLSNVNIRNLPVDDGGLVIDDRLRGCNCVYVTPSNQCPTTTTMPLERRLNLLSMAGEENFLIIEDDYDCETDFKDASTPALKSLDDQGRVIYLGTFSRILSSGVRLAYIVAPSVLIKELEVLRNSMASYPASNIQRPVSLFIERGHYDAQRINLINIYEQRYSEVSTALASHLPGSFQQVPFGGTTVWVKCAEGIDVKILESEARKQGIIIEDGATYFLANDPPRNFFRLGFSSIATEKIEPGIRELCELIAGLEEAAN